MLALPPDPTEVGQAPVKQRVCVSPLTPPSVLGARAAALTHLFTQQLPAGASRRPALCWVLGARREPRSWSAQEGFLEEGAVQQRTGQEFTRQGLQAGDAADRALGTERGGGGQGCVVHLGGA